MKKAESSFWRCSVALCVFIILFSYYLGVGKISQVFFNLIAIIFLHGG